MRIDLVLLLTLLCAGCAALNKPVAQAAAPAPAAVTPSPAPVADASPPRFECSDGTISFSQAGCLVNMAKARLPPSQPTDPAPTGSISAGPSPPTPAR